MTDIKIYYDKELTKEVIGNVKFLPVKSGETNIRSLYIHNLMDRAIDVDIEIDAGDVKFKNNFVIESGEVEELNLNFEVSDERIKPFKGKITLNYTYIIK